MGKTFLQPGYCRVYQGKVDGGRRQSRERKKSPQKDPRNKTVVTHTHTHAKRHKSPPKNPTVTLRIHTQPSGMSRGHTRPKIQRDKEMDVSF